MLTLENLFEPREIADRYPGLFTAKQLEWMIRNRRRSGLDCALVKVHRKIFIDKVAFEEWLESHRCGEPPAVAATA